MALPSTITPYVTASYRGRLGDYAVTIFGPSAKDVPVWAPASLALAAQPDPTFAEPERAFGGGLMPWSVDYEFVDPDRRIEELFGDEFDPRDYPVQVTGPNGFLGAQAPGGAETWTVWTRPMRGEVRETASPLTSNPEAHTVALGTHDGIATLSDIAGASLTGEDLAQVVALLWHALPGVDGPEDPLPNDPLHRLEAGWWDITARLSVTSPDAANDLLDKLRLAAEIMGDEGAGSTGGDVGTVQEQLLALVDALTLTAYQPTDGAPDGPTWEVAPRSRVGLPGTGTRLGAVGDRAGATSGAFGVRTMPLPLRGEDRTRRAAARVRRAGTIIVEGDGQATFPLTRMPPPGETPNDLGSDTREVRIGRFTPATPDGDELRFVLDGLEHLPSATTPGGLYLRLDGEDGQAYYGPTWSTTRVRMRGSETPGPEANVTLAPMPVAGIVTLEYEGATDVDGDGAIWLAGAVLLQDDQGAPVTGFAVRVGAPGGEAVTLPLLPRLEALSGGTWSPAETYDEAVSGLSFGVLAAAQAAARAAQRAVNLRWLDVETDGLHGPQSRFTLAGRDGGNADSPFAEDVTLIPVGGDVDLRRGLTRLALVAATETAPA